MVLRILPSEVVDVAPAFTGMQFCEILCVPLCPLWFRQLRFLNHKGHKGTQRISLAGKRIS